MIFGFNAMKLERLKKQIIFQVVLLHDKKK
jgi:hypothetical protein